MHDQDEGRRALGAAFPRRLLQRFDEGRGRNAVIVQKAPHRLRLRGRFGRIDPGPDALRRPRRRMHVRSHQMPVTFL